MKPFLPSRAAWTCLLASTALATSPILAQAASYADVIFVVDESGSMSGEHAFLADFVTGIETNLASNGITLNFGLTGYGGGGSTNSGHAFLLDGNLYGDAAAFSTAAGGLVISGSTEDGYAALNFALNTYSLTPNASVTFVLVTDEDRDNTDATLDFNSILADLNAVGANLVVVVDAQIQTSTGADGISTDGSTVLVQNGSTTTTATYASISSNQGNTTQDYVALALQTANGCVADLNYLRLGGDSASAFAEAFATCVTSAATAPNPQTGGSSTGSVNVYQNVQKIVLISHGRVVGTFTPSSTGGGTVTRAAYNSSNSLSFAENAWGVEGLDLYFTGTYSFGEYDATSSSSGFDFDGGSATIGATYQLPNATALGTVSIGGALSYGSLTARLDDGDDSRISTDALVGSAYGMFMQDSGFHGKLQATFGRFDYSQVRDPAGNSGGPFRSSPEGRAVEVSLELGKELAPRMVGAKGKLVFDPFVALTYQKRSMDAYDEDNGGMSVAAYDADSFTPEIGIRATLSTEVNGGTNFAFMQLSYAHDTGGGDYTVAVNATDVLIESEDEDALKAKFAIGRDMAGGLSALLMYEGDFTEDSRTHSVSASFTYKF